MLRPDYPIVTERLLLRPLDPVADVDAVHAYQSLPDAVRYVPYGPRSRADVAENLASSRIRSTFETPGHTISLAVVLRESGALIGDVMLVWSSEVHRRGEIGYILHPDHHGHGYVTEACEALLHIAFEQLELHRVVARIDERNAASAAVLRRLGMREEARLVENEWFKGEWTTELDFAVLAREWRERRAAG
ncbi:GNAT family N-acetyltransferase [Jatrophihabitans endophyticus]|uniref:GNAT family N-acetyltransferase n=1 Tax=Jatrophihabitans endophyticus TaxID=1206085 RepID=UPI00093336C3|nr:GNAT family N-acetyltransferase [Jatrophihabitans endophyticus]